MRASAQGSVREVQNTTTHVQAEFTPELPTNTQSSAQTEVEADAASSGSEEGANLELPYLQSLDNTLTPSERASGSAPVVDREPPITPIPASEVSNAEEATLDRWRRDVYDHLSSSERCEAVRLLAEGSDQEELDRAFSAWLTEKLPPVSDGEEAEGGAGKRPKGNRQARRARGPNGKNCHRPPNRRVRRAQLRSKVQSLYEKDPSMVIRAVLEGRDLSSNEKPVFPEGTTTFWRELVGRESPSDDREPAPVNGTQWNTVSTIVQGDVVNALKKLSNSAPGLDKLKRSDLLALPANELADWFTLWLYLSFKKGRTTLLPKVERPSQASQYRPITVSSMLARLFHSVIASRLRSVPINYRQKGYRDYDGIAASVWKLRLLVEHAKNNQKSPLYVVFLDVKKAFDSVSHESMLLVLAAERAGLPRPLLDYLKYAHEGCTTQFSSDPNREEVAVRCGVKQGDPLACYLFNFQMDWASAALDPAIGYPVSDGVKVNSGLLADDTWLAASTPQGLQRLLDVFLEELRVAGMSVNASKCASLTIKFDRRRKRWYRVILVVSDWVMLTQFRLRITSK